MARTFAVVMASVLAAGGCGSKPVPAEVRVLKEGTFTIVAGQPFYLGDIIPQGTDSPDFRSMYEYAVTATVTAGDPVQIRTTASDSEKPGLSVSTPTKDIKLVDRIDAWEGGNIVVKFSIATTGTSSDVKVKITKQFMSFNKRTGTVN